MLFILKSSCLKHLAVFVEAIFIIFITHIISCRGLAVLHLGHSRKDELRKAVPEFNNWDNKYLKLMLSLIKNLNGSWSNITNHKTQSERTIVLGNVVLMAPKIGRSELSKSFFCLNCPSSSPTNKFRPLPDEFSNHVTKIDDQVWPKHCSFGAHSSNYHEVASLICLWKTSYLFLWPLSFPSHLDYTLTLLIFFILPSPLILSQLVSKLSQLVYTKKFKFYHWFIQDERDKSRLFKVTEEWFLPRARSRWMAFLNASQFLSFDDEIVLFADTIFQNVDFLS